MNCQLSPPLKPGDLLRVIAPSDALRETEAFNLGVEIWRSRGYQVELSTGIDHRWGYLAGKDSDAVSSYSAPACGVPVIAYRRGGSAEIIQDGSTGFLVKPDSLTGLVDAIARLNDHESGWQNVLNNLRLIIQPLLLFWLIYP